MDFFPQENFDGSADSFEVGTVKHLVLNTKYKSIRMGKDAGLLVWAENHPVPTVKWTTDKASFQGDEKLYECFQVLAIGSKPTFIIGIRFKDTTGAAPGRYLLTVKAADIGNVNLKSNEDDKFAPVGTMPFDGKEVTTAIYVRDTVSGVYVATGSIFFGKNQAAGKVEIKDDTDFPKQLKHEQSDSSDFTITLISTEK